MREITANLLTRALGLRNKESHSGVSVLRISEA